jgi:hypothetical protein
VHQNFPIATEPAKKMIASEARSFLQELSDTLGSLISEDLANADRAERSEWGDSGQGPEVLKRCARKTAIGRV